MTGQSVYVVLDGSQIPLAVAEIENLLRSVGIRTTRNSTLSQCFLEKMYRFTPVDSEYLPFLVTIKNLVSYSTKIGVELVSCTLHKDMNSDSLAKEFLDGLTLHHFSEIIDEGETFKIELLTVGKFRNHEFPTKSEFYSWIPKISMKITNLVGGVPDLFTPFHQIDFIVNGSGSILLGH
ncbi:MAG TPA: hypothetical protein VJ044_01040, partial [Candidatus Hodarchaeales archaeon]|nr:hypothetical protein [Candidatus Hodarchaeales archaeon]